MWGCFKLAALLFPGTDDKRCCSQIISCDSLILTLHVTSSISSSVVCFPSREGYFISPDSNRRAKASGWRGACAIDRWTNATRTRASFLYFVDVHLCVSARARVCVCVCVCVFAHQLEAFWTGPRVKGSANTLSLSAARVITPGWNYSTFVYKLPWAHCK